MKNEPEMNTTNIKEPIEQKEKQKVGQLLETISLRDYFAAKAMQNVFMTGGDDSERGYIAMHAYKMADAMLKAREA
jgi:hypothetical protein